MSKTPVHAAIERLDDVYMNTYEGGDLTGIWRFDGFEIMVDGDHSGGQYVPPAEWCNLLKPVVLPDEGYDPGRDPCRSNFQAQQYLGIAGQGVSGYLVASGFQTDFLGQLFAQLTGIAAIVIFAFALAWLFFKALDVLIKAGTKPGGTW